MILDHSEIKLEINSRKTAGKFWNICLFKNTILNIKWFKEDSIEIKIHFELKENENTTYQNLLCAVKAVFRGNL